MLLARAEEGETALHVSVQTEQVEKLNIMWVEAEKENLNTNEVKKNLLAAKDKNGYIAWHTAALFGSLEALKHYGIGLRKRI